MTTTGSRKPDGEAVGAAVTFASGITYRRHRSRSIHRKASLKLWLISALLLHFLMDISHIYHGTSLSIPAIRVFNVGICWLHMWRSWRWVDYNRRHWSFGLRRNFISNISMWNLLEPMSPGEGNQVEQCWTRVWGCLGSNLMVRLPLYFNYPSHGLIQGFMMFQDLYFQKSRVERGNNAVHVVAPQLPSQIIVWPLLSGAARHSSHKAHATGKTLLDHAHLRPTFPSSSCCKNIEHPCTDITSSKEQLDHPHTSCKALLL